MNYVCVCVCAHRAVEDHAVSVAQALDMCCQVEADGSMADGVHSLSIKEVVRSGWRQRNILNLKKKNELHKKKRKEEQT